MTMRWRAGSSHQLPDALSRLPRPGPAADPIDDSFPDDTTSRERDDYEGPQGPVLGGVLLKDQGPLKEGVVDPGGAREKRVGVTMNTANPRLAKPRPSDAPSLPGTIVESVPQACRNTAAAQTPEEEGVRDGLMLTPSFHDSCAALRAGAPVAVRQSTRVLTASVRLQPLPEPITRTVPTTSGSTGPQSTRANARRA